MVIQSQKLLNLNSYIEKVLIEIWYQLFAGGKKTSKAFGEPRKTAENMFAAILSSTPELERRVLEFEVSVTADKLRHRRATYTAPSLSLPLPSNSLPQWHNVLIIIIVKLWTSGNFHNPTIYAIVTAVFTAPPLVSGGSRRVGTHKLDLLSHDRDPGRWWGGKFWFKLWLWAAVDFFLNSQAFCEAARAGWAATRRLAQSRDWAVKYWRTRKLTRLLIPLPTHCTGAREKLWERFFPFF